MNVYSGKICLLFIVLITYTPSISSSLVSRNRAFSNPEIQKSLQDYQKYYIQHKQHTQAPCPANSPVASHSKSPREQDIIINNRFLPSNSSDFSLKLATQRYLDSGRYSKNSTSKDELLPTETNASIPRRQAMATQIMQATIANKPFMLQPPILQRQTNAPHDNNNGQFYRAIQFIEAEYQAQQDQQAALQKQLEQAIQHDNVQKKLSFLKAAGLVTPLALQQILERHNQQSRFGVIAATTSIASMLPTIFTVIGGLYGVYMVDRMLHAEERIAINNLKKEIAKKDKERDKKISQEFSKLRQGLEAETNERKKTAQELKQQFTDKITELEINNTTTIEKYTLGIDKLNEGCKTLEEAKELNKSLIDQLAKIIPANEETLDLARKLVNFAEKNEINMCFDPRLDNIEYSLLCNADQESVQQISTKPKTLSRQDSLSESSFQNTGHVNSNDFQNQFKSKRKKQPMYSKIAAAALHTITTLTSPYKEEIEEEKEHTPRNNPDNKQLFSSSAENIKKSSAIKTSGNKNNTTPSHNDQLLFQTSKKKKPESKTTPESETKPGSKSTPNSKTTPGSKIGIFALLTGR